MKLIQKKSHAVMLWKNQLGSTRQMDIFPPQADFAKEDFLWRLSSAEVASDSPFSLFQKYDRLLTLLGPGSIKIQDTVIDQSQIYSFRGDQQCSCKVLSSHPIIDLGLIYQREKIRASMKFLILNSQNNSFIASADKTYIICSREIVNLNDFQLSDMDCVVLDQSDRVVYQSVQEAHLILVEIFKI